MPLSTISSNQIKNGTIVDADINSSSNIATTKLATGGIIKVSHFTNNTRTALSTGTSVALWSGINVTKSIAQSKLIIIGLLCFTDGNSYHMGEYWKIGSSGKRYDGIVQNGYGSDGEAGEVQFGWMINAEYDSTETGSLAVEIGWGSADGGSDKPAETWNQNSTDDSRAHQKASTLTIFEVAK